MPEEFDVIRMLRTLVEHEVEFIIVGGVAASLLGSPLATRDLDILYNCDPANNERLLKTLLSLEARYHDLAGRHFEPTLERLASMRMHLLITNAGRLDVLRLIGGDLTYGDFVDRVNDYEVEGFRVRALRIEALIELKKIANRPKDHHALTFLRRIREMESGD